MECIHDEMLAGLWPGSEPVGRGGLQDRGLLASAVHRPFQSAFGEDIYPSVEEKAAALFHSLIANHPFVDGNKRTAVIAVSLFLIANSRFWFLGNDAMYRLATRTASYRERDVSHEEVYREILDELCGGIISFAAIRQLGKSLKSQPELLKFAFLLAQRLVRGAGFVRLTS